MLLDLAGPGYFLNQLCCDIGGSVFIVAGQYQEEFITPLA